MTFPDATLLAAAGVCAGMINAVAGGGSLVSFSALIALGYPPVTANVTNTVGVLPGYLGGAIGYKRELRGQGARVRGLALTSGLGALAGAVLLITTPAEVFEFVVPLLILASSALLVAQPWLARLLEAGGRQRRPAALQVAAFAAGLYGGYFAAGFGVLLLAVLRLLLSGGIQRLNALKGVLSLIIGAVAAATFAIVGPVAWSAAAVMGPRPTPEGTRGELRPAPTRERAPMGDRDLRSGLRRGAAGRLRPATRLLLGGRGLLLPRGRRQRLDAGIVSLGRTFAHHCR